MPLLIVTPLIVTWTLAAMLRTWTALPPLIVVLEAPAPFRTAFLVRLRPLPLSV